MVRHVRSPVAQGQGMRSGASSIPTGSQEKQNAPDSGQAFFVPDLTGPGLAQRLENKGEIDLDSINYTDSKSG